MLQKPVLGRETPAVIILPVGQGTGQGAVQVIAVANQKGGVGKTTTALNLAAALAQLGAPTLLLDLDPQANASAGLGLTPAEGRSIYDVLLRDVPLGDCILPSDVPGLSLVPSHIDLSAAELELASEPQREFVLRGAMAAGLAGGRYAYVIIDCPPSLGLLTLNALSAADSVLIPVQTEFYSLTGLVKLLDTIQRVQAALNPQLKICGAVLTMYDARTNLGKDVVREVKDKFPGRVFETIIPRSVRLAEAPSFGKPISLYEPGGASAQAFMQLARELSGVKQSGQAPPPFDGKVRINLAADAATAEAHK
jgi:chromosome partitioning protein